MGSFPPFGWQKEVEEKRRKGTSSPDFWGAFAEEVPAMTGRVQAGLRTAFPFLPQPNPTTGETDVPLLNALADPFGDKRMGMEAFAKSREQGTVLPAPRKISEDGTPRPAGHAAPETQTGSDIPSPAFFQRPEPLQLEPVKPSSGIFAEERDIEVPAGGPPIGNFWPKATKRGTVYTNIPTAPGAQQVVEGRVDTSQQRINDALQNLDAGMLTGDATAFDALNKTLSEMNPLEAEEAMRRAQGPLAPLFMQRQKQQADYEREQAQITGEQRQENIARRRVLGNEPEQAWLQKRATLIAEDLKQQLLSDPARQGKPLTRPEALQIEQEAKVRAEVMLSDLMMRSFFSQINRYPGSPTGGLDPFGG